MKNKRYKIVSRHITTIQVPHATAWTEEVILVECPICSHIQTNRQTNIPENILWKCDKCKKLFMLDDYTDLRGM